MDAALMKYAAETMDYVSLAHSSYYFFLSHLPPSYDNIQIQFINYLNTIHP